MIVKNVTTKALNIEDINDPADATVEVVLRPNVEKTLYNEDVEKSKILKGYITSGAVVIVDQTDEPQTGTVIDDSDSDNTLMWLSNDKKIQFVTDAGDIATNDPEIYTATAATPKTIRLALTDGDGTRDRRNSTSTVKVTATGGTVNSAADATVTFTKGLVSVSVLRGTAGNVDLALSNITHPLSADVPPTLVVAAGTAQIQFA